MFLQIAFSIEIVLVNLRLREGLSLSMGTLPSAQLETA